MQYILVSITDKIESNKKNVFYLIFAIYFIFIPIISYTRDLYMKKQQFKTFALLNI